jgi:hypothetical protein
MPHMCSCEYVLFGADLALESVFEERLSFLFWERSRHSTFYLRRPTTLDTKLTPTLWPNLN